MSELRSCPFCGKDEITLYSEYNQEGEYDVYAQCKGCGARTGIFVDPDDPSDFDWETAACLKALKAWNRRGAKKNADAETDRDDTIQEWLDRNLCLGEDKDALFKPALIYELDRIADSLEQAAFAKGFRVYGNINTYEQN